MGCLAFEFGNFLPIAANDNSAGTVLRKYVHSTRDDDPQVWLEGAGNSDIRHVFANYQGSVVATTNAAGSAVQIYKYGTYGEPKDGAGNPAWNGFRFRYTGQQILPEAKLYYYKARVYDPNLGIFLQTDPIGTKDDLNLYAYVQEDPINNTDPTGLIGGLDDAAVIAAGALAGVAAQGIGDVISGHTPDWRDYAGSAVGGAVTAELTYNGTILSGGSGAFSANRVGGAVGGAAGEVVTQSLKEGKINFKEVAKNAAIGAVTNIGGGKAIKGITSGKGSWEATSKQIATNKAKGEIKNVTPSTAGKIFGAKWFGGGNGVKAGGLGTAIKNLFDNKCKDKTKCQ